MAGSGFSVSSSGTGVSSDISFSSSTSYNNAFSNALITVSTPYGSGTTSTGSSGSFPTDYVSGTDPVNPIAVPSFNPTAEQLTPLIGKPVAEVVAGLRGLGATIIRNGDGLVTMDFAAGRVTYQTDGSGNVTRISIEGGITVPAVSIGDPVPSPLPTETNFNKDVARLDAIVGLSREKAVEALNALDAASFRFVGPGGYVTADFVEGRITASLDANGLVTGYSVEGDQGFATNLPTSIDLPIPDPEPEPVFRPTLPQLEALIGQSGTDAADALTNLGATDIRIIGPDDLYTMDFVPGRASIYVDASGVVTRIKIEGVADTSRPAVPPENGAVGQPL